MRVLLINSNRMRPPIAPLGLDYLADSLHAAGHQPVLLDLCFSEHAERDIAAAVSSSAPEVVGLSVRNTDDCFFASGAFLLPGVRAMVATVRRYSDAPVALGGVGFSIAPDAVLEYCGADYAVAGEGEESFPRFLAAFRDERGFTEVPGLLWRDDQGTRRNPPGDAQLEFLPPRTRSFVDNRRYFREGGQAGFETKRGCPLACTYCADPVSKGRRSRLLPPYAVVAELRALLEQGIDCLHTCDSEFNVPPEHAREVCRALITAGLGERIRWYAYCTTAHFDAETAELFRRAGCAGIDFGADSGSAEMLRRLGRHFGPADLESTARHCRAAGIPFMYDLLVGGPGETWETVGETIDLVRRVGADCVGISLGVRVYEGTALAEEVRCAGPLEDNPDMHGAKIDNARLLRPVFFLSPALGEGCATRLRQLVAGDQRFFLPGNPEEKKDYNYNDNELLVRAIAGGARGAYWDILRRMR
jgi:radical SAM superfamily enzyme YgiQ (UPF0313 family)